MFDSWRRSSGASHQKLETYKPTTRNPIKALESKQSSRISQLEDMNEVGVEGVSNKTIISLFRNFLLNSCELKMSFIT